jgi:hypothetical protein
MRALCARFDPVAILKLGHPVANARFDLVFRPQSFALNKQLPTFMHYKYVCERVKSYI